MSLIIQNLILESVPVDQRWGPRLNGQDQGLWEALVRQLIPLPQFPQEGGSESFLTLVSL